MTERDGEADGETDGTTGGGRGLTYAELAEVRGITRKAAVRMTQRHRWRRTPGNDGTVRVLVPDGMAARHDARPDGRLADTGLLAGAFDATATAFETALAAIEATHARELATLREQVASAEQARARMEGMVQQFADQLHDADEMMKAERARSVAEITDLQHDLDAQRATIDELRAGQALMTDMHARELAATQDRHARELAVAQDRLERVRDAAEALRQADAERRARGLVARLRAAWRGE